MADSKSSAPEPTHVHPALPLFGGELSKWEAVKARDTLIYQMGYGNEFATEAVKDALPKLGNTPLRAPHGLYAEQVSGTSFTTPRVHNRKVWMYKVRPSAAHAPMRPYTKNPRFFNDFNDSTSKINPNQLRWKPFPIPSADEAVVDFIDGVMTLGGAGCPAAKAGCAVHIYTCNASMAETRRAFCNSDGDLLIVPQQTPLLLRTELGKLRVAPGEFVVVPRGIKFAVDLEDAETGACPARAPARGYICEVYDSHFVIPDLGPIGANGLANPRHFAAPVAAFEDVEYPAPAADVTEADASAFHLVQKFVGKLFAAPLQSSPFDVVAWTGNYTPFKYDLAAFNTVNSVSYDHLDPSIFTVLTAQTTSPGVAACDFVVFPPRFAVQDNTFRPPYYHRNCMTEFMGNIQGQYDAKPEGFVPGSASLHSCMMGHGPDADTYAKFSNEKTAPQGPVLMNKNDLAFMFESTYIFKLSKWANAPESQQTEYYRCWAGLKSEYEAESK
jgi:homogentisate 1,2-dioxygenase